MSQSAALLCARLTSGASASCSGRLHVRPHPVSATCSTIAWQATLLAQRGNGAQHCKQAARAAGSIAVPRAFLQQEEVRRCRRSRGSEGKARWPCRARSRFAEETASEEDDLDALVDDDIAAGGVQSCSINAKPMRPDRFLDRCQIERGITDGHDGQQGSRMCCCCGMMEVGLWMERCQVVMPACRSGGKRGLTAASAWFTDGTEDDDILEDDDLASIARRRLPVRRITVSVRL